MKTSRVLWMIFAILLVALISGCSPAASPTPRPAIANPSPTPQPSSTPRPASTATPQPGATPTLATNLVLPTLQPDFYSSWKTYTHPVYGFSFSHPADWIVEEDLRSQSTSYRHLLWIKSPASLSAVLGIGFKKPGEPAGIQRTGVGNGELFIRGWVILARQAIFRNVLVAETRVISVLYNTGAETQRGGLIFTLNLESQKPYEVPLSEEAQQLADAIVMSISLPE